MPHDTDEIQMLRDHQRWLLTEVIPGYYELANDDSNACLSVDSCLEQLFDIAYQIKLLESVSIAERSAARKLFNEKQRRIKQTYLPYKDEVPQGNKVSETRKR